MSLSAKEAFKKLPEKLHNFFIKYPPRPFTEYSSKPSTISDPNMNPFLPNKNEETGKWHDPRFSLRRSADLFKMAYKFGIQDLLPPIPHKRFYADKYYNKNWMRGVLFQKKHKWERGFPEKLKERQEAIAKMDEIIAEKRPSYKKQIAKRNSKKIWW
ncbi:Piso0_005765 [Millerozyma farinosa CBS 7064]|uniref:Piso0_005765 protein n=1 Tax=Pichia sorbitophila (strain ATCC MYA-4447 / BCRC 22081 / CBS 7064 / NBRC 10061 / NRRL Y-12695) TaxID=559304 RepID=G8Y2V4_PICSO|nr:Piso0_005765 [Millerozyma farinosa CBS 7064]